MGLIGFNAWRLSSDYWPTPSLAEIRVAIARGRTAEAEAALRAYLAKNPRDGEARQEFARLLAAEGDNLDCAEQLREVPEWWPGKREAQAMEGQAWKAVGRIRPAERAWLGAVAYDPLHPVPWDVVQAAARELVVLYVLEGRVSEAREVLEAVLKEAHDIAPADVPAILALRLQAEIAEIEPAEAILPLRRYLEADPDDLQALRALAVAEEAAKHPDQADALLSAGLEDAPGDVGLWRARLKILMDRNDDDALAVAVSELPEPVLEADDAIVLTAIGQVAEAAGALPEARRAYRKAVEADPFDPTAPYRLSLVLTRLGLEDLAAEESARHQRLRLAYEALPKADTKFRVEFLKDRDSSATAEAIASLANLCETVGRDDLAVELREIAPR